MAFKMRGFNPGAGTGLGSAFTKKTGGNLAKIAKDLKDEEGTAVRDNAPHQETDIDRHHKAYEKEHGGKEVPLSVDPNMEDSAEVAMTPGTPSISKKKADKVMGGSPTKKSEGSLKGAAYTVKKAEKDKEFADKATTLGVQKYWDEHDKRQKLKKQKQKDLE